MLVRDARQAGRSVSRYQAHSQANVAGIDSTTDVAVAKVDSVTAVTGQAMGAVLRVAQARKQLELLSPEVSGHLAMLADGHALTMLELTDDHRRSVRRFS
jgi:hypothetical protein